MPTRDQPVYCCFYAEGQVENLSTYSFINKLCIQTEIYLFDYGPICLL